jgi:hypothetical protein
VSPITHHDLDLFPAVIPGPTIVMVLVHAVTGDRRAACQRQVRGLGGKEALVLELCRRGTTIGSKAYGDRVIGVHDSVLGDDLICLTEPGPDLPPGQPTIESKRHPPASCLAQRAVLLAANISVVGDDDKTYVVAQ